MGLLNRRRPPKDEPALRPSYELILVDPASPTVELVLFRGSKGACRAFRDDLRSELPEGQKLRIRATGEIDAVH